MFRIFLGIGAVLIGVGIGLITKNEVSSGCIAAGIYIVSATICNNINL